MSCRAISSEEFARIIPVSPPMVNRKMNPRAHNIGGSHLMVPPCNVASQLKTLIPVGMAMIMVADVKYARVSTSIPTVNIWCAHTINPRNPMESMAHTMPM